jgi:predicted  nucleic acid-binding Zn-ribbon protein
MSAMDLRRLHELHLIDFAIFEIKKKAASLDPGRGIQAQIAKLSQYFDLKNQELHALTGEQKDLELAQQSADARAKRINDELYGGKTINPREIENLQAELKNIAKKKDRADERLLELMELIPPAKKLADDAKVEVDKKKAELAEFQKGVLVVKKQMEDDFKTYSQARPAAEKAVDPVMLAKYNAIKAKQGGIGMTDVVKGCCAACGMKIPTKAIEGAKEGKVFTCEACHRIIYATDGLV